jgi:hypothetical protein
MTESIVEMTADQPFKVAELLTALRAAADAGDLRAAAFLQTFERWAIRSVKCESRA